MAVMNANRQMILESFPFVVPDEIAILVPEQIRIRNSVSGEFMDFIGTGLDGSLVTGLTAGTVTELQYGIGSTVHFSITGLNLSAVEDLRPYLDVGDPAIIDFLMAGADTVNGSASADMLSGFAGHDMIHGNGGIDSMEGGAGNDTLDGGTAGDDMAGNAGNDTFIVNTTGDSVHELAGQGTDTVRSTVAATLSANVERLVLTGTADIAGTGNGLANTLTGNAGNNTLNGKAGVDVLIGGGGSDTLIWSFDDNGFSGGTGTDVLKYLGAGINVDLTLVSNALIDSVERFNIGGTGANMLKLNYLDVLAMSSTDALRVDGGADDTLRAGSGWADGGASGGYHSYSRGGATLTVDVDINCIITLV
jgi:Ca2+-binding RTX toxin-like protein